MYKKRFTPSYQETMGQLFEGKEIRDIEFQVTEACNLKCTYCYQHHKTPAVMTFDLAKRLIDNIFDEKYSAITPDNTIGLILSFIGGEPFLQVDLMEQICDYTFGKMFELNHPWLPYTMISICSNGVLVGEDKKTQHFLEKYRPVIDMTISIDGCQELHDLCRVDFSGQGSYIRAMKGVDYVEALFGKKPATKMTFAPANITYVSKALINLIELGYDNIPANCVFEPGWTYEDATIFYNELKKVADYIIDNELNDKVAISIFEEDIGYMMPPEENTNYCWGKGTPILTDTGYKPIEEIKIGDLVYTHTGELKSVIDTKKHFDENVCEIRASGTFKLICTKNHKLFTRPFDYIDKKHNKIYKPDCKQEVQNIKSKDLLFLYKNRFGNISYDKELCYLIGRFVGDGYTTTQNGKSIVCGLKETEELKKHFEEAQLDYSIYYDKTVNEFHAIKSSKNPNNILFNRITAQCGKRAENKCVPTEIWNWDEASVLAFIEGYIDADGYKKKENFYTCNTVSYRLANELMVLLRSLGYTVTCYKCNRAGESYIQGRKVNIRDRYEVYFRTNASKSVYIKQTPTECTTCNLEVKDAEPQEVYNLTVANNHSYIAGGLVSSNCGGSNHKNISMDYRGNFYPCIRFMESSLNGKQEPFFFGDIENGVGGTQVQKDRIELMDSITRRSQSTDECFYCPIGQGCQWCSACCYEYTNSPNKRITYICPMHKARVLANIYYWNRLFEKLNIKEAHVFKLNLSKEECLKIIPEKEYNLLKELERR